MNNRKVFAELSINEAPSCHITLVSASGLTEQEAQIVQLEVDKRLKSMMPLHIELGNYCMVGNSGSIPAYECRAAQSFIHDLLCSIYAEHYRPTPGKRCYPKLKMHITVDTPEKLAQIEEIFRVSPDNTFESGRYNIGSRLMDGERIVVHPFGYHIQQEAVVHPPIQVPIPQFNPGAAAAYQAPPSAPSASDHGLPLSLTPNTWLCGSCNKVNSMTIKECGTGSCTQWRPMPQRQGDWQCCGEMQFGSRNNCRKCGRSKSPKRSRN